MLDELVDSGNELLDALERSAPDGLLRDESAPSFNLVEPGRVSGREVEMEARFGCEPCPHLGVLVCGVVVDDPVHVQFRRDGLVDASEKAQKFLMAVARLALCQYHSRSDIERGEQRCGSVSDVVMGHAFYISEPHRQDRLRAIQGLNLGLFVHGQNQRMVGRIQVKTDHVANLLHEERVGGEFEALAAVGLQSVDGRPRLRMCSELAKS